MHSCATKKPGVFENSRIRNLKLLGPCSSGNKGQLVVGLTRSHVGGKKLPELCLGAVSGEHVLDSVLESKVERLCWEISDNIGQVASPETCNSLLCGHSSEAVHNACKTVITI